MSGQMGRAISSFASWWAAQEALVESYRSNRRPPEQELSSEAQDERYMEMQQSLARHVSRRYEKKEDQDA
jgi:hypothetical protein